MKKYLPRVLIAFILMAGVVWAFEVTFFDILQLNSVRFQTTDTTKFTTLKGQGTLSGNLTATLPTQSGTLPAVIGGTTANHIAVFNASGNLIDGGSPVGSGTVTSVSVTTANGVSAVVSNPTSTPNLTFTLGAITPTSVNGLTISATGGTTGIFPATNFTVARTDAAQTFTGVQTFSTITAPVTTLSEFFGGNYTLSTDLNGSVRSVIVGNTVTMSMSESICIGTSSNCQNNSFVDNNGLSSGGVPYGGPDTCIGYSTTCQGTSLGSFTVSQNSECVAIGPSSLCAQLATFAVGDKAQAAATGTTASTHGAEIVIGDAIRAEGYLNISMGNGGNTCNDTVISFQFTSHTGNTPSSFCSSFQDNSAYFGGVNLVDATKSGIRHIYWGNGDPVANASWTNATPFDSDFNVTGGKGTDVNGANATYNGGRPTGAGVGGSIFFGTATAGSTGTTLQSLTNRLQIDSVGNISAINQAIFKTIPTSQGGPNFEVGNSTATTEFFDITTFATSAHAMTTALGTNFFLDGSATAQRNDTSGAAVAWILDAQVGTLDRIYARHITAGGSGVFQFSVGPAGDSEVLSGGNFGWSSSSTDAALTGQDTAIWRLAAGSICVGTGSTCSTAANMRDLTVRHLAGGGTAPTITAGFGSGAAIVAGSGDAGGKVGVGTTPGTTGTITFGTSYTTAPACIANDESTKLLLQATSTQTTLVIQGVFVNSDVISWNCIGK